MTVADLTALLKADLSARDNRLVLADLMEECGRGEEAAVLRAVVPAPWSFSDDDFEPQPVVVRDGRVVPAHWYVVETSVPGRSHREPFLAADDGDALTQAPELARAWAVSAARERAYAGATARWFVDANGSGGRHGPIGDGSLEVVADA